MKAIFITGTDTGVGKTIVSAGLCAFLSLKNNMDVGVMKPFETGLIDRDQESTPSDVTRLQEASGSTDDLDIVNPYAFGPPLAPEIAADLEQTEIDLDVLDRAYDYLLRKHDMVIVEGAGGVLVPIRKNFFFSDLMKRWRVPVIVVSRLRLGTINHTLLTNEYLQSRGIRVIGVVLNDVDGLDDLAARTNPGTLERYLNVPIIGVIPHIGDPSGADIDRAALADLVARHLDTGFLLGLGQDL